MSGGVLNRYAKMNKNITRSGENLTLKQLIPLGLSPRIASDGFYYCLGWSDDSAEPATS